MNSKSCNRCKQDKPLDSFGNLQKNKDGKSYYCKSCEQARQKALYYKDHKQTLNKIKERWYHNEKYRANQLAKSKIRARTELGMFSRYQYSKAAQKYGFDLQFYDFKKLINSNCFYCGVQNCRGVDRIDSLVGYKKENVVSCCSICNTMKMALTQKEFFAHVTKIFNYHL